MANMILFIILSMMRITSSIFQIVRLLSLLLLIIQLLLFIIVEMPRARRNKVVALTKVKKDVHGHKESLVTKVRNYLDNYKSVCVLEYQNMTTNPFKQLKQQLKDSKFCLGKNKVMAVAIGRNQEQSYKPNSYILSQNLKGQCCLFFTNKTYKQINQIFEQFQIEEYAQVGTIANQTIILERGFDSLKKFTHSIQPYLRSLGLSTRLVNSQIQLLESYLLAEQGKPLSVQKCKILKLLDIKLGTFKINIRVFYNTETGGIRKPK